MSALMRKIRIIKKHAIFTTYTKDIIRIIQEYLQFEQQLETYEYFRLEKPLRPTIYLSNIYIDKNMYEVNTNLRLENMDYIYINVDDIGDKFSSDFLFDFMYSISRNNDYISKGIYWKCPHCNNLNLFEYSGDYGDGFISGYKMVDGRFENMPIQICICQFPFMRTDRDVFVMMNIHHFKLDSKIRCIRDSIAHKKRCDEEIYKYQEKLRAQRKFDSR